MSTQVIHGFRCDRHWNSPKAMQAFLGRYRKAVRAMAYESACDLVAHHAVQALDHRALGLPPPEPMGKPCGPNDDPWTWAWGIYSDLMVEARRKPAEATLNLECTVVLYPCKGFWLTRVCPNNHQRYVDAFVQLPGLTPYDVDTRTDDPEGIPRREYSKRVRLWEATDDGPRLFCECLGAYGWPFPDLKDCVPRQATHAARAHDLAVNQLMVTYLKEHTPEKGHEISTLMEGMDWLRTPEGQKILATTGAEILLKTPDRYEWKPTP
jgi:hypothetical protein